MPDIYVKSNSANNNYNYISAGGASADSVAGAVVAPNPDPGSDAATLDVEAVTLSIGSAAPDDAGLYARPQAPANPAAADPAVLSGADLLQTLALSEPEAPPPPATPANSYIFIDQGLADLDQLRRALAGKGQIVLLDDQRNGLEQIAEALAGKQDIAAIHVLSHGSGDSLQLGGLTLSDQTIAAQTDSLQRIGRSLASGADILLYGCDFGQDHPLVERIAQLTGADVAASDNLTGAAALGGDWVLEQQTGAIQAQTIDLPGYDHTFANVSLTGLDSATSLAGSTTPQAVAANAVLAGVTGNLSGYVLTVSLAGHLAEDQLGIRNGGTGAGQIGVAGSSISYGGTVIATVGGGANGADLTVTFNANATQAAGQTLVRSLTYANTADNPTASRVLTLSLAATTNNITPTASGGEFRVNSYTASDQNSATTATIAALTNGGFVVTWTSNGQDGSATGVYGQRFDAGGVAAGAEFRINTTTAGYQFGSTATALSNGGFVVTWTGDGDGSATGIYGQRYDGGGATVGSEFKINSYTPNYQYYPTVSALNDGGFAVTWYSYGQEGDSWGVYGQRFGANGAAAGSEFHVNTATDGDQYASTVAGLTGGGLVVTWESGGQDGSGFGVYGQRFDAAGARLGSEFRVNGYTTGDQLHPSVAALTDGGFVVSWASNGQDGSGWGIYGQRYNGAGTAVGGEFRANTTTSGDQNSYSAITGLADGGFLIAWQSAGQDGSGYGVYAQRYDAAGTTVGGEFRLNGTTAGDQYRPAVAGLANGKLIATWDSSGQDGSGDGVYGQIFSLSQITLAASATTTIAVTPPNHAPTAADRTVTVLEDTPYSFRIGDFGFGDVDGGDSLSAVRIETLPGAGRLTLNGQAVTSGQSIAAADIGNLSFSPAAGAHGTGYGGFQFSVADQSGVYAASPNRISIDVTPIDHAPTATDLRVTTWDGTPYSFKAGDFGFGDVDSGDSLSAVRIETLPGAGSLTLNGQAVSAGQSIAAAQIANLSFNPAGTTAGSASFQFSVADQSGVRSATPNQITVDIRHPPTAVDSTIIVPNGRSHSFQASDFGFGDADAGDSLSAVRINDLPVAGNLLLNGQAVAAGQSIAAADIGNLTFTSTAGTPASVSFGFSLADQSGALTVTPHRLTILAAPTADGVALLNDLAAGWRIIRPNNDLNGIQLVDANLTNAWLAGADLSDASITGGSLDHANFYQANLSDALIDGADVTGSGFTGVNFAGATLKNLSFSPDDWAGNNLSGATLDHVSAINLQAAGANLSGATIVDANLTGAWLAGADLSEASITGGSLAHVNFYHADLSDALIDGAGVTSSGFTGVNFAGATLKNLSFSPDDWAGNNLSGATLDHVSAINLQAAGANLSGATIVDANLTGAWLAGADLSDASITGGSLAHVNFYHADLSDALIDGADVTGSGFTGVNFAGATLKNLSFSWDDWSGNNLSGATLDHVSAINLQAAGANLSGATITASDLTQFNLQGGDLSGAVITGGNLTYANLNHANLSGAVIDGAIVLGTGLVGANLSGVTLRNLAIGYNEWGGDDLSGATLDHVSAINLQAAGVDLSGATITASDLTQTNLLGADLSGASITGGNLTYANLNHANLSGAVIDGAIVLGTGLVGANLSGVTLRNLAIGYNEWGGDNLSGATLDHVSAINLQATGADLSHADITASDLTQTNLAGANLSDAAITGSNLTNTNLGNADLRGATFDQSTIVSGNFTGANLTGTTFRNTTLQGVQWLLNTTATGVTLDGVSANGLAGNRSDLSNAVITDSDLTSSRFILSNLSGVDIRDSNLTNANLRSAILGGATIDNSVLAGVNFNLTNLSGTVIKDSTVTGANWTGAILSGTSIQDSVIDGANWAGDTVTNVTLDGVSAVGLQAAGLDLSHGRIIESNLTSANLAGANLTSADLAGTNLTAANLAGVNLTNADLAGATLDGTALASVNWSGVNLADATLKNLVLTGVNLAGHDLSGASIIGSNLSSADLAQADLAGATIDGSVLTGVDFTGTTLSGVTFKDVALGGTDLSGHDLSGATLNGVAAAGLQAAGANLSHATITGSDLSAADLAQADLNHAIVKDGTLLRNADLAGADLTGATLANVVLAGADLAGADLTGADLTGADLTGVDLRGATLTGAILTGAKLAGALSDDPALAAQIALATAKAADQAYVAQDPVIAAQLAAGRYRSGFDQWLQQGGDGGDSFKGVTLAAASADYLAAHADVAAAVAAGTWRDAADQFVNQGAAAGFSFAGITADQLAVSTTDQAYLAAHPTAATAVAAGRYKNGFDQWLHDGADAGLTYRGQTKAQAESTYLAAHPEVAAAIAAGRADSALHYYVNQGAAAGQSFAGIDPARLPVQTADQAYLAGNAAAAAAVAAGRYQNGLEQWVYEGARAGQSYNGYSQAQAEAAILAADPSIAGDVANGRAASVLAAFVGHAAGSPALLAGIDPAATPVRTAEQIYLAGDAASARAVQVGYYKSGFDAWLQDGAARGLSYNGYSLSQAEAGYLIGTPGVAAAVQAGQFASGQAQFLAQGAAAGTFFAGTSLVAAPIHLTVAAVAVTGTTPDAVTGLIPGAPASSADQDYLAANPAAAAAIAAGHYRSGFDQWLHEGADAGLAYDGITKAQAESAYRDAHPDVAAAIAAGQWDSALHQFVNQGAAQGRSFAGVTGSAQTVQTADQAYLSVNAQAAAQFAAGLYVSGFDQWLHQGARQGLSYNGYSQAQAESAYLAAHPEAALAVAGGQRASVTDVFAAGGAAQGNVFAGISTAQAPVRSAEQAYLAEDPAAARDVQSGLYRSGFDAWLHGGADRGLSYDGYSRGQAEAAYLAANPGALTAVAAGQFASGLDEFLARGAAAGLLFAGTGVGGTPIHQAAGTIAGGGTGLAELPTPTVPPAGDGGDKLPGQTYSNPQASAAQRQIETAYLVANPTAASEIAAGTYTSGFDQWLHEGGAQGARYNGYSLDDAVATYLVGDPALSAAATSTALQAAIGDFLAGGTGSGKQLGGLTLAQALTGSAEETYLAANPGALNEVRTGSSATGQSYLTGFQQWLHEGIAQGLTYNGLTARDAEAQYLQASGNADVSRDADRLTFQDAFADYLARGQYAGDSIAGFSAGQEPQHTTDYLYLAANPDAANAVANGSFASGFDQWVNFGITEGRSYNGYDITRALTDYLNANADVRQEILARHSDEILSSYVNGGIYQGRSFAGINPNQRPARTTDYLYLASNSDVARNVSDGGFSSGFDQWLHFGGAEGRNYNGESLGQAEWQYLNDNPDVVAQYGWDASAALTHYLNFGRYETRSFAGTDFWSIGNERTADVAYLGSNAGAAAQVASGQYQSGFDQWVHEGLGQGYSYNGTSPADALARYITDNSDVAQSILDNHRNEALSHYRQFGRNEGRSFAGINPNAIPAASSGERTDLAYLAANRDVAAAVANGGFRDGFDQWLRFGATDGRSYNGQTLASAGQAYLNAHPTLAATEQGRRLDYALNHYLNFGAVEGRSFAGASQAHPVVLTALEENYLAANPDVAAEVAQGRFKTGFDHWLKFGAADGHNYFGGNAQVVADYLAANPALGAQQRALQAQNAISDFLDHGQTAGHAFAGLDGALLQKQADSLYLAGNQAARTGVASGQYKSGFDYWLRNGTPSDRYNGVTLAQAEQAYFTAHSEISAFYGGNLDGARQHFLAYGAEAGANWSFAGVSSDIGVTSQRPTIDQFYLAQHADAADAVRAGRYVSGFDYWLHQNDQSAVYNGKSLGQAEADYLQANHDVDLSATFGSAGGALAHFLAFGAAEGRSFGGFTAAQAGLSAPAPAPGNAPPDSQYLAGNQAARQAVAAGQYLSGFDYWLHEGNSTEVYNGRTLGQAEAEYLAAPGNGDVAGSPTFGSATGALQHFLTFGAPDNRRFAGITASQAAVTLTQRTTDASGSSSGTGASSPANSAATAALAEQRYLAQHPDITAQIGTAPGQYQSGFDYWLHAGANGGQYNGFTLAQAETLYLNQNREVSDAYLGSAAGALQHFLFAGYDETRRFAGISKPDALVTTSAKPNAEQFFLAQHPDAAAQVTAGQYKSGFDYWLHKGDGSSVYAGRTLAQAESDYLAQYSDVAAVLGNDPAKALQHFLTYGAAEGRSFNGLKASQVGVTLGQSVAGGNAEAAYLAANPLAAAQVATGVFKSGFDQWLHEGGLNGNTTFNSITLPNAVKKYIADHPAVPAIPSEALLHYISNPTKGFAGLENIPPVQIGFGYQAAQSSPINIQSPTAIDGVKRILYAAEVGTLTKFMYTTANHGGITGVQVIKGNKYFGNVLDVVGVDDKNKYKNLSVDSIAANINGTLLSKLIYGDDADKVANYVLNDWESGGKGNASAIVNSIFSTSNSTSSITVTLGGKVKETIYIDHDYKNQIISGFSDIETSRAKDLMAVVSNRLTNFVDGSLNQNLAVGIAIAKLNQFGPSGQKSLLNAISGSRDLAELLSDIDNFFKTSRAVDPLARLTGLDGGRLDNMLSSVLTREEYNQVATAITNEDSDLGKFLKGYQAPARENALKFVASVSPSDVPGNDNQLAGAFGINSIATDADPADSNQSPSPIDGAEASDANRSDPAVSQPVEGEGGSTATDIATALAITLGTLLAGKNQNLGAVTGATAGTVANYVATYLTTLNKGKGFNATQAFNNALTVGANALGGAFGGIWGAKAGASIFKVFGIDPEVGSVIGGSFGSYAGGQLAEGVAKAALNENAAVLDGISNAFTYSQSAADAIGKEIPWAQLATTALNLAVQGVSVRSVAFAAAQIVVAVMTAPIPIVGPVFSFIISEVAQADRLPPAAYYHSQLDVNGQFSGELSVEGSTPVPRDVQQAVVDLGGQAQLALNSVIASVGGVPVTFHRGNITGDPDSFAAGWTLGEFSLGSASGTDINQVFNAGTLSIIRNQHFDGGDPLVKRAIAHSSATTVDGLLQDIAVAQAYRAYLLNKSAIDAAIGAAPDSDQAQAFRTIINAAQGLSLDQAVADETTSRGDAGFALENGNQTANGQIWAGSHPVENPGHGGDGEPPYSTIAPDHADGHLGLTRGVIALDIGGLGIHAGNLRPTASAQAELVHTHDGYQSEPFLHTDPTTDPVQLWDVLGDGVTRRVAGLSAGVGILVRDVSGDGSHLTPAQFSFADPSYTSSGLAGLAVAADANGDGQLTSQDNAWSSLKVLLNGQLYGLSDLGIKAIRLTPDDDSLPADAGNDSVMLARTSFLRNDGSEGAVQDLRLAYDAHGPASTGPTDQLVPNLLLPNSASPGGGQ